MAMQDEVGALSLDATSYIDRLVNKVPQGLKQVKGLVDITIQPESKEMIQQSYDVADAGQVKNVAHRQSPTKVTLKYSAFNPESMAVALMGESALIDVGAGTQTGLLVTAKLDCFVELGVENLLAASFEVTNTAGTVTYVKGVDYEVNYALGMIKALSSGDITEAQSLKVNLANSAYSGFKTTGATQVSITGRILIHGVNIADGDVVKLDIYEAVLTSKSAVSLMGDKFVEVELSGFMVTAEDKTEPFYMEKRRSA